MELAQSRCGVGTFRGAPSLGWRAVGEGLDDSPTDVGAPRADPSAPLRVVPGPCPAPNRLVADPSAPLRVVPGPCPAPTAFLPTPPRPCAWCRGHAPPQPPCCQPLRAPCAW